jgi:hypothetical protein
MSNKFITVNVRVEVDTDVEAQEAADFLEARVYSAVVKSLPKSLVDCEINTQVGYLEP